MNEIPDRQVSPVLEVVSLSKHFSGVQALADVSMPIYPGEIHTLLGENGAGKSTLLKAMFGAHRPDSGHLMLDGLEVHFHAPADALRAGLAMVHQELSLVPQMNAIQNIVLGREQTRVGTIDWKQARKQALGALAAVGYQGPTDTPVNRLSVAQQQLIEIARALSTDARIIILDEPTAALTTQESNQLFELIRGLRSDGKAIVYVSHRLKEVLDLSDRVTVLRDGRLVGCYQRAEITGEADLIKLMVGRNLDALGVRSPRSATGKVVLDVRQLSVAGVVHDVSLQIRAGEVVGIAGMMGAGRTELVRAIAGADRPSAGEVLIDGELVSIKNPRSGIKAGIALLTEDRKAQGLLLHMTTASNVTLMDPPGKGGLISRRNQRRVAIEALRPLNAKMRPDMLVRQLSGGTQQKVVLGKWLLSDSRVFVFDEPTRGIDVGAKGEIHQLMRGLADSGRAVLMVSSDLPEVLSMSDRVLVMRRGRIVAELTGDDINEETVVLHAASE